MPAAIATTAGRPALGGGRTAAAPGSLWSLTAAAVRMLARRWREMVATERLEAMNDAMLKDIGITRSEIHGVVRRGAPRRMRPFDAG